MAGLVPAIHAFVRYTRRTVISWIASLSRSDNRNVTDPHIEQLQNVDGRDKPGHDES